MRLVALARVKHVCEPFRIFCCSQTTECGRDHKAKKYAKQKCFSSHIAAVCIQKFFRVMKLPVRNSGYMRHIHMLGDFVFMSMYVHSVW
jgi:hypothetical protein